MATIPILSSSLKQPQPPRLSRGCFSAPEHSGLSITLKEGPPSVWLHRFRRKSKISGAELLAALAFFRTHQTLLKNASVALCLDSNNAIESLLRGDSCDSFISATVAVFWKLTQQLGIAIWVGRVKSELTVADFPTRSLPVPYPAEHSSEFKNLPSLMNECLVWSDSEC